MYDDAALKRLVQIAIYPSGEENDYPLAWIIDIGLKDQTPIVKIGAAWATGDNAPNIQRSAMRFEKLFKIGDHIFLVRRAGIARLEFELGWPLLPAVSEFVTSKQGFNTLQGRGAGPGEGSPEGDRSQDLPLAG